MTFGRFGDCVFTAFIAFILNLPSAGEYREVNAQESSKEASQIVKRVKKTIDRIDTFSCWFEWEHISKAAQENQRMSGTIIMKKPFKFRLVRKSNTIVNDGETVWTYLPKHNQVQITDAEYYKRNFPSPLTIFNRYSENRDAVLLGGEEINGKSCDVLSLVPSDPEEAVVTVWIDREIDFPIKAVEEFSSGDVTTHILSGVKLNKEIDDDVFFYFAG